MFHWNLILKIGSLPSGSDLWTPAILFNKGDYEKIFRFIFLPIYIYIYIFYHMFLFWINVLASEDENMWEVSCYFHFLSLTSQFCVVLFFTLSRFIIFTFCFETIIAMIVCISSTCEWIPVIINSSSGMASLHVLHLWILDCLALVIKQFFPTSVHGYFASLVFAWIAPGAILSSLKTLHCCLPQWI